jgi:hypothetical protein
MTVLSEIALTVVVILGVVLLYETGILLLAGCYVIAIWYRLYQRYKSYLDLHSQD